MLRKVAAKAMSVGRFASAVFGLALVLALVFGVATMALGANGGNFILGQSNAATSLTRLTGNIDGAAMQIINSNAGSDDTALNLQTQDGEAPMRVTSDTRVANLNADKLDNLQPSQIKGAKAYAIVNPESGPSDDIPVLVAGKTSGFTSVERIDPGVYCLTAPGLSSENRPAVVSIDRIFTDAPTANASAVIASTTGCAGGGFQVYTNRLELDNGSLRDVFDDSIGFVIVVL